MKKLIATVVSLVALATATTALAVNPTETVRFTAVGGSGVGGTATLGANGTGTAVKLAVTGLKPGSIASVQLRTGPYPKLGASFATVAKKRVGATGVLRAATAIRFRGEPVAFDVVADGDHVLVVVAGGKVVAHAAIPGMD